MKAQERFPAEHLQVLTHFYRGEVQRSTDWRVRLDITTNWAVIATTATFSWAFMEPRLESHILFVFTSLTVFLLLCLEARRYRHYDVWHTRVRMLEVHLLVPALNPELDILQGNWRAVLSNDLLLPSYKISFLEAFSRRLASNYIWLFLLLFFGWMFRVYSGADTFRDDWVTIEEFYLSCGYNFVHPNFFILFEFGFTLGILAFLLINWRRRMVTGEIRRRDPNAPKWSI